MRSRRLFPVPGRPVDRAYKRLPGRLLRWAGTVAFVALVGWLLTLNTADDRMRQHPYRPFTPQEAARRCSIEAGITQNAPGQRMSEGQMDLLTACMDREMPGPAAR